jgi:DNA mismatch repair ATPase MutL
MMEEP